MRGRGRAYARRTASRRRLAGGHRKEPLAREVLESLELPDLDHPAGRLRFEDRLFLGERVDALAFGSGRFADDFDLHQTGQIQHARSGFAKLVTDELCQFIEEVGNVLLAKPRPLGHILGHVAAASLAGGLVRVRVQLGGTLLEAGCGWDKLLIFV